MFQKQYDVLINSKTVYSKNNYAIQKSKLKLDQQLSQTLIRYYFYVNMS